MYRVAASWKYSRKREESKTRRYFRRGEIIGVKQSMHEGMTMNIKDYIRKNAWQSVTEDSGRIVLTS